MANVEAVIPNTKEAKNMVEMMNKNMVGYLRNCLPGEGINNKDFVERLLHASCDKSLFRTAAHCTWDTKTKVLSTSQDKNREKEKKLEQAAYNVDQYSNFMYSGNVEKKGKQLLVDPEKIFMILTAPTSSNLST